MNNVISLLESLSSYTMPWLVTPIIDILCELIFSSDNNPLFYVSQRMQRYDITLMDSTPLS